MMKSTKKMLKWIILLLLVIIFVGIYKMTQRSDVSSESVVSPISSHKARVTPDNASDKKKQTGKNTGSQENFSEVFFEGDVFVKSQKFLAPGQSEACAKTFKEDGSIGEGCAVDEVIFLERADGKEFDAGLYAMQTNERTQLHLGCKQGDAIMTKSYGKYAVTFPREDQSKILEALGGKDPLHVRLAKKVYTAYEVDNPHCAVSWNVLKVGKASGKGKVNE